VKDDSSELFEKNPNITIEEVKNNLEMRDFIDSNREVSPLRQAADALVDNSKLTEEQQLDFALRLANSRIRDLAETQLSKLLH
jgi:cytidylate kinase